MHENEQGFSLLEVLLSLVIITMILLFFSSFFVQHNNVSVRNTEKLVVVNLADAYLERMRIEKKTEMDLVNQPEMTTQLNDRNYKVEFENLTSQQEREMKLLNVLVRVTAEDGKTVGKVEGYVEYD